MVKVAKLVLNLSLTLWQPLFEVVIKFAYGKLTYLYIPNITELFSLLIYPSSTGQK